MTGDNAEYASYAILGCRHCSALFVGPEPGVRILVEGDPYRSEGL